MKEKTMDQQTATNAISMESLLNSATYKMLSAVIEQHYVLNKAMATEQIQSHDFIHPIYKEIIFYYRLNPWGTSLWTMEMEYIDNIQIYDANTQKPISVMAWTGFSKTKTPGRYEFQPGYVFNGVFSDAIIPPWIVFDLATVPSDEFQRQLTRFFTLLVPSFVNSVIDFDRMLQLRIDSMEVILMDEAL